MRAATTLLLAVSALTASAQQKLTPAIVLPHAITNGVAIEPAGRTFLVIAKQKGQEVPQVAEWKDGRLVPYPNATWNSYKSGDDAGTKWIHANSIRFDPEGTLWIVDVGSPDQDQPVLPHGAKLVGIDIATGKVRRTILLDSAIKPNSFIDDVRFNGDHAYLSDAGEPGLLVVHMPEAAISRVLDHDTSTTALKPLRAEGRELHKPNGSPIFFHADQIELSPDGKTLYYQPCSGPMSAIDAIPRCRSTQR